MTTLSKTVAVMQPYFIPYAGYFAMMRAVDHFVILDCVQFPRRGWVHRNKVPGRGGAAAEEWVTLPLAKQPQDTLIKDLAFAPNATETFASRLRRHSWLWTSAHDAAANLRQTVTSPLDEPLGFLAKTLRASADTLGIDCEITLSSDLEVAPTLKGEERIIAIAREVGARHYVNLSGGRELYKRETFRKHGLTLQFMAPYRGARVSLLYRLCTEPLESIRQEIAANAAPID